MSIVTLNSQRTTVAVVLGWRRGQKKRLHATDPNDVFAPLCGERYDTAQTVAIASGLHDAPASCEECMRLAPSPVPSNDWKQS